MALYYWQSINMSETRQKKKPVSKLEKILLPVDVSQPPAATPAATPAANPPPAANPLPSAVIQQPVVQKKRGRKRKIALDAKYFDTSYITMWPEICMGQKVLVDRYDNVYSYDLNTPTWLGVKNVYGKIEKTPLTKPRTDYKYSTGND